MVPPVDTSFWRQAYEEHGPAVLAFLRSRVTAADDAEELMQETFVRAIRSAHGLREPERVRGYLFTTAHNLLRNHQQRSRVSPVVAAAPDHDVATADAADARARLRSVCDRLVAILETMSEAHRRAFELGVLDKMPYREIARLTGWTPAQVKVNVYRARKRAMDGLAEFFADRREAQA